MAGNSGTLIEVDSVSKKYNETVSALEKVSFSVEYGEFLTIVGRSGSGKSTLLYIIGGLDHPTGGEIRISGNVTNFTDRDALVSFRRKKVGFVFQQFNLLPAMTAVDNVAYPLLFHRRPRQERLARAEELLGLVVWLTVPVIFLQNSQGENSSVWLLPGHLWRTRRSFLRMNRLETWIHGPPARSTSS